MSKIKLEAPFRQFRGKICKHSDIIFKQMYGETFTSQICNPRTSPYTPAELAHQTKFATCVANTRTRMKDPAQQPTDEAAFKAQKKYKTLYAFIFADEWAKL